MASYTVQSGDNLSSIAQRYGTNISNISGYRSGNPNLIFPGEVLSINNAPPVISTSNLARTQVNSNLSSLQNFQSPFLNSTPTNSGSSTARSTPSSVPQFTPSVAPQNNASNPSATSNVPAPSPSSPIQTQSNNAALQSIINTVNNLITTSGVPLTPENQSLLNKINGLDASVKAATSSAQSSADSKDYKGLNDNMQQAKTAQQELEDNLKILHQKLTSDIDYRKTLLNPGQDETDLQTKLADLQKEKQNFELSLQEGQQAEYGMGRPVALSTGRAQQLAINNQFKLKQYSIDEANVQAKLKILQDAREAKLKGSEFDITTAMKQIDDATTQQKNLLDVQSKTLDSIGFLASSVLSGYEKNNDEEGAVKAISDLAKQYGIDPSLLLSKAQEVQLKNKQWSEPYVDKRTGQTLQTNFQTGEVRSVYNPPAKSTTSSGSGGSSQSDAQLIAQAIMNGDQPPVLTGLYGKSASVKAELEKQGYNLTKATQDWTATQKYLATLSGAQQVRLRQATNFAYESLNVVDELNSQWKGGKFPLLNKANLALAKGGALGADAQSLATRLDSQIADLQSELATVFKGGNSSTDESLKLASQMLQSNWSQQQLADAINLVRTNLQIRLNSIKSAGVAGNENNSYAPNNSTSASDINSLRSKYGY